MVVLNKTSIQSIGVTLSVAVLAVTGIFVAKPLFDSTSESKVALEEQKMVTLSKTGKLAQLEEGVDNIEETQSFVDKFLVSAPNNKDVESASRAISTALISGVNISSFTFGQEENIEKSEVPKATLGEYVPPMELSDGAEAAPPAEGEADGDKKGALETFHRIPMQITVNADSYNKLAEYVDELAKQKRLISIVSVNSTKGSGGAEMAGGEASGGNVEATIYAYAFIYAR